MPKRKGQLEIGTRAIDEMRKNTRTCPIQRFANELE